MTSPNLTLPRNARLKGREKKKKKKRIWDILTTGLRFRVPVTGPAVGRGRRKKVREQTIPAFFRLERRSEVVAKGPIIGDRLHE